MEDMSAREHEGFLAKFKVFDTNSAGGHFEGPIFFLLAVGFVDGDLGELLERIICSGRLLRVIQALQLAQILSKVKHEII